MSSIDSFYVRVVCITFVSKTEALIDDSSSYHYDRHKPLFTPRGKQATLEEALSFIRSCMVEIKVRWELLIAYTRRGTESYLRSRIGTQLRPKRVLPDEMLEQYMTCFTRWILTHADIPPALRGPRPAQPSGLFPVFTPLSVLGLTPTPAQLPLLHACVSILNKKCINHYRSYDARIKSKRWKSTDLNSSLSLIQKECPTSTFAMEHNNNDIQTTARITYGFSACHALFVPVIESWLTSYADIPTELPVWTQASLSSAIGEDDAKEVISQIQPHQHE